VIDRGSLRGGRNAGRLKKRRLNMFGFSVRAALTVALLTAATGAVQAAGNPAAGRAVFQTYCSICHSVRPGENRIGPSLFGVYGRETGSVPGYSYSPANRAAHLTWDDATLDRYLASPRTVIPGTKMTFAGLQDATKRQNLIAYLATLK
jgi:cytochrome c